MPKNENEFRGFRCLRQPIIDKGRALQAQFAARLLSGMSERQRQAFADAAAVINHNLDEILQEVH